MAATDQQKSIAEQFLATFYKAFDTNRASLLPLYADQATLTYEGQTFNGKEAICRKLTELPFQSIVHNVTTYDAQATVDSGLLVFVVGQLKADQDQVIGYSETFYLKQFNNSLFVVNDIFRLNLHHQ